MLPLPLNIVVILLNKSRFCWKLRSCIQRSIQEYPAHSHRLLSDSLLWTAVVDSTDRKSFWHSPPARPPAFSNFHGIIYGLFFKQPCTTFNPLVFLRTFTITRDYSTPLQYQVVTDTHMDPMTFMQNIPPMISAWSVWQRWEKWHGRMQLHWIYTAISLKTFFTLEFFFFTLEFFRI